MIGKGCVSLIVLMAASTPLAAQTGPKAAYDELYTLYRELHDAFGGVEGAKADFPSFMKRLLVIRERQAAE